MTARADLALPLYRASFGEALSRLFRKYFVGDGRASRSEFWWPQLLITGLWLVTYGLSWAGDSVGETAAVFLTVSAIAVALATMVLSFGTIALGVRRLHDANVSGWWYLALLVAGLALRVLAPDMVSTVVVTAAFAVIGLLPTSAAGKRFDEIDSAASEASIEDGPL
ncbi:DUF805 domain-containing protein [Tsukamurella sp. 1534]|uniref:DUF805 domain-containing protein n=1 Tax=Tsukamurella sp. 1534 TaxID=1151061 RepID=UPI0002E2CA29|nr:DUF805 domain-containing protein [Tsukamurella sp. 1534]